MADPLHILITGGSGQVGSELLGADWPDGVVLHAPSRDALDSSDIASVRDAFAATPFAGVINAGAYTAVDKAETEVAAAFAVNAMGPAVLAEVTRAAGVPLVHVSTDYVFDGSKTDPYVEDDPVAPLGVYGASKSAGELAVRLGNPRSVVLRTSWVLSGHGANFLKTMLGLAADRSVIRVVGDQHGCPTSARDIAETLKTIILRLIAEPDAPVGVYHFVNAGETSWAGLATEILALSENSGGPGAKVDAITTAEYPTLARRPGGPAARRPGNSRLSSRKLTDGYGIHPRPWRDAVREIITDLLTRRAVA